MTDRPKSQDRLFWLCVALSLTTHVGVAVRLLSGKEDFGATDRMTISVNIASPDILDAAQQSAAKEADGAPAAPNTQKAEPDKAEAAPPRNEPETTEAEASPLPASANASPPPAPTAEASSSPPTVETVPPPAATEPSLPPAEALPSPATAAERAASEANGRKEDTLRQAAQVEREKQEADRQAREKASRLAEKEARAEREAEARDAERKARSERAEGQAREKRAQAAASAGANGSRGAKASAGRVSASRGALQNYKGVVNAWMARNKPAHNGARGDVVIFIALSPSGALISAHVTSSSGNPTLDQMALAAARRSSPFPTPPPGSTAGQLLFTFPYYFR